MPMPETVLCHSNGPKHMHALEGLSCRQICRSPARTRKQFEGPLHDYTHTHTLSLSLSRKRVHFLGQSLSVLLQSPCFGLSASPSPSPASSFQDVELYDAGFRVTVRPHSSSFLGLPHKILNMNPEKELLWGLRLVSLKPT